MHMVWWFSNSGGVWYMYLKIENMCLKTCVEICVGKKYVKIHIILFKN